MKYHVLLPQDEGVGGAMDYYQWQAILRSVSALRGYHWVYQDRLKPWLVAELLILRPEMPRSLLSCYDEITQYLDLLAQAYGGKRGECHRFAGELHARLRYGRIQDIFQAGAARVPDRRHRGDEDPRPGNQRPLSLLNRSQSNGRAMQLQVKHQTTYRYDAPVSYTIQSLRLSPRPHHGLSVLSWRVQADGRRELPFFTDGFGNIVHSHSINRTHDCITLLVEGEVETTDTAGILRGGAEPLPPAFYLRSTPLTVADGAIEALAAENGHGKSTIERLHRLMIAVRERVDYRLGATDVATTAAEALARGVGVCQDHSHIFIAAARHHGIPARYVGGYLWTGVETQEYSASHAWVEAYVQDLGWVGFDAANCICPTAAYIRTSIGLDYSSAMPVRGIRRGESAEDLTVRVSVTAGAGDQ